MIIGVAGGSGSGKTTLAHRLKKDLDSSLVFELDRYYLPLSEIPREQRVNQNFDHPDMLDWDLIKKNLKDLSHGKDTYIPRYSFQRSTRTGYEKMRSKDHIIVEGLYALHPFILPYYTVKIFLNPDPDVRVLQRTMRDVHDRGFTLEHTLRQYRKYTKPMYEQHVEPTKKHADLVLKSSSPENLHSLIRATLARKQKPRTTLSPYL